MRSNQLRQVRRSLDLIYFIVGVILALSLNAEAVFSQTPSLNFPPDSIPLKPLETPIDEIPVDSNGEPMFPHYAPSEQIGICEFNFWQVCSQQIPDHLITPYKPWHDEDGREFLIPGDPILVPGQYTRLRACEAYVMCKQETDPDALICPLSNGSAIQACLQFGPKMKNPIEWIPDVDLSNPDGSIPIDFSPKDIEHLFERVCPWNGEVLPGADPEILNDCAKKQCEAPYEFKNGLCCKERQDRRPNGIWGCYDPAAPKENETCSPSNVGNRVTRSQLQERKIGVCTTHDCRTGIIDREYEKQSFGAVQVEYVCQCEDGYCSYQQTGRTCEKIHRQSCEIDGEVECNGPGCFLSGRFFTRKVVETQSRQGTTGDLCEELGLSNDQANQEMRDPVSQLITEVFLSKDKAHLDGGFCDQTTIPRGNIAAPIGAAILSGGEEASH